MQQVAHCRMADVNAEKVSTQESEISGREAFPRAYPGARLATEGPTAPLLEGLRLCYLRCRVVKGNVTVLQFKFQ